MLPKGILFDLDDTIVSFDAVADNYSDITDLITVFENNEYVSTITISSARLTSAVNRDKDADGKKTGVGFTISLKVRTDVFYK